jgi:hypothetical protein
MEMLKDCVFVYISVECRLELAKPDFYRLMANEALKKLRGPVVSSNWYERIRGLKEIGFEELVEFLEEITEAGQKVVYLFDEFELATINPNLDADFFTGLRSIANLPKVSFILATKEVLTDLVSSETLPSSPFFNIFTTLRLGLFKQEEAEDLIMTLSEGLLKEELFSLILETAGLHPFFLQLLAYLLFEIKNQKAELDNKDYEVVKEQLMTQANPHFNYFWDELEEEEKNALISLAKGHQIKDTRTIDSLIDRWLVVKSDNRLKFFSSAFEEFVKEENTWSR